MASSNMILPRIGSEASSTSEQLEQYEIFTQFHVLGTVILSYKEIRNTGVHGPLLLRVRDFVLSKFLTHWQGSKTLRLKKCSDYGDNQLYRISSFHGLHPLRS